MPVPAEIAEAVNPRTVRQREHQRRYRGRQRVGIEMVRVPISRDIIEALLLAEWVDEQGSRNPKTVGEAAAIVLRQWSKRWIEKKRYC